MLYESTRNVRGSAGYVSSAHAITKGLADDGGLYLPLSVPRLTMNEICLLVEMSYIDRACYILQRFLTDFAGKELKESLRAAYSEEKFGATPVPLKPISDLNCVLELWHGPTAAFKDMALQLLPHLLSKARSKTCTRNKTVILTATSGDTGKAALEGFRDVEDTEIIVFYPQDGVSAMQKLQMTTTAGRNVHVYGVAGDFDAAQKGVKELFADKELAALLAEKSYAFSSANSINWGRLVPQIVYYFSAYADALHLGRLKKGEPVLFSVPTGNFGDIFAGYLAQQMGLPVGHFICGSNSNNVLSDFFATGEYDIRERKLNKTISPSMDILVSSNLERLLYLAYARQGSAISELMTSLNTKHEYQVTKQVHKELSKTFYATWVDEVETAETMSDVFRQNNYLVDPHTAVGWRALEKYRILSGDERQGIVLATASPFKFSNSVLKAVGRTCKDSDPFVQLRTLADYTAAPIPKAMTMLEHLPILHQETIAPTQMREAVLRALAITEK